MKQRNITIDILKLIAIILIILAHTAISKSILQIRNFDVVLLVIVSAFLYSNKKYNNNEELVIGIKERVKRLILPVWIFLTIFFALSLVINLYGEPFSKKDIIGSYDLTDGIGYVWIIRVYILCAISVPILLNIKQKYGNKKYYIFVIVLYILYEIIYKFFGNEGYILSYIVYYIIPYGILCSSIGIELKNWTKKQVLFVGISFLAIFMIMAIYLRIKTGNIIFTQVYKYPPRIYYLSYSIGISLILYYLIEHINILKIKQWLDIKIVQFVSSHTMWIYLWHILILSIINSIFPKMYWWLKFIIILLISVSVTYIQSNIVNKLKIKNKFILKILDS